MPQRDDQDVQGMQTVDAFENELEDVGTRTVRIEALSDSVFGWL